MRSHSEAHYNFLQIYIALLYIFTGSFAACFWCLLGHRSTITISNLKLQGIKKSKLAGITCKSTPRTRPLFCILTHLSFKIRQPALAGTLNTFTGMHPATNVGGKKRAWNSASPHRVTAVPCTQMQAGVPAKEEKAPCTSTPCSPSGNAKIVQQEASCRPSTSLTFRFSVFLLDWFCPPLLPRRRWFESMRRAVPSMEEPGSAFIPAGSSLD